jgi:hypothetical protein
MNRFQYILQALFKELAMPRLINRVGDRFGRLTVIAHAGRNKLKKVLWQCQCDCGKTVNVPSGSLVTGNTTSCGCFLKETITKHGGWQKSSYNTWRAMMRRCYNLKDKDFSRYGAVGVTVCLDWHDYATFAKDMGEPSGAETLDRIDPYGNYTPENCRWASLPTQARNTRVRKNSDTGVTGVHKRGNKFLAEITAKKKKYYSKVCTTLEEAAKARKELERLHWGVLT